MTRDDEIRALYLAGERPSDLARKHGVSQARISQIIKGITRETYSRKVTVSNSVWQSVLDLARDQCIPAERLAGTLIQQALKR